MGRHCNRKTIILIILAIILVIAFVSLLDNDNKSDFLKGGLTNEVTYNSVFEILHGACAIRYISLKNLFKALADKISTKYVNQTSLNVTNVFDTVYLDVYYIARIKIDNKLISISLLTPYINRQQMPQNNNNYIQTRNCLYYIIDSLVLKLTTSINSQMVDDIEHDHSMNIVYEGNTTVFLKGHDDIYHIENSNITKPVSIKDIGNNHVIFLPFKFVDKYAIELPYLQPPNNVPQAVQQCRRDIIGRRQTIGRNGRRRNVWNIFNRIGGYIG